MIKMFKLITGEDVVSVTEETETSFFLKWPAVVRRITVDVDGEQQTRSAVEPLAPHIKGHCVYINKNKILFMGDALPALAEYYEKTYAMQEPTSKPIEEVEPDAS